MVSKIKINKDCRGIAPLLGIVVIIIVAVAAYALISQAQPHNQPPIKVQAFEVQPSEFNVKDKGTLTVELENTISTSTTSVRILLETSNNVQIYQGNSVLPKQSGYYIYEKQLSPSEVTTLKFTLTGTIEVGDNSRDYYVKAYCYVGETCYSTPSDSFIVKRS